MEKFIELRSAVLMSGTFLTIMRIAQVQNNFCGLSYSESMLLLLLILLLSLHVC